MTYSEKKKAYNTDYTKSHYKRISLILDFDTYDKIKLAASLSGESINGYIKAAILARLASDPVPEQVKPPDNSAGSDSEA